MSIPSLTHVVKAVVLTSIFVHAEQGARAALTLNMIGETQSIDFQNYTGTGLTAGGGGGALDSDDWQLFIGDDNGRLQTNRGETVGAGIFGRGSSSGGVSERGFYSFETGNGNRALGIQLGDTDFPGALPSLQVQNETGFVVDQLHVRYDIWVNNDSNNSNYFDLEFGKDSTFIDPVFFETPVDADASPAWVKTTLEYDLLLPIDGTFFGSLLPIEDGQSILVDWSAGGLGVALNGFDEIAIDNIQITAYSTAIPEPTSSVALLALSVGVAVRRRRKPQN